MTNGQENDFQDENLENLDQTSAQGSTEELSLEEKLQNELANANDKYTRLFAEFDNYKKTHIQRKG